MDAYCGFYLEFGSTFSYRIGPYGFFCHEESYWFCVDLLSVANANFFIFLMPLEFTIFTETSKNIDTLNK